MNEYFFTFGSDHYLEDGRVQLVEDRPPRGLPLRDRFVRVRALDEMSARTRFIEVMGRGWSSVYDAGRFVRYLNRYHPRELELEPGGLRAAGVAGQPLHH